MNRVLVLTIVILSLIQPARSQVRGNRLDYVSAGIKFGVDFDDEFIYGFEVSYGRWPDGPGGFMLGGVLAADALPHEKLKLHAGVQISTMIFGGVDVGPSLLVSENTIKLGYTLSYHHLAYVIPYISHSGFPSESVNERGAYLKLPIELSGKRFFNFD